MAMHLPSGESPVNEVRTTGMAYREYRRWAWTEGLVDDSCRRGGEPYQLITTPPNLPALTLKGLHLTV